MAKKYLAGFTIMEMAVAVLILAGLATMAVPYMGTAFETMRSKEGVATLLTVYQAQVDLNADIAEGRIASYVMGDLDITFATAPDAFNAPVLDFDGSGIPPDVLFGAANFGVYAHIERSTGAYTLYVQGDTGTSASAGRILCNPQSECEPMGYDPW
jgi:type II secretory pathway pseudopilin PulG